MLLTPTKPINYTSLNTKFQHCIDLLGVFEKRTSQGVAKIGSCIAIDNDFVPYQIIISQGNSHLYIENKSNTLRFSELNKMYNGIYMDKKTGRTTNFENLFAIDCNEEDITHKISSHHGNIKYIGKHKANEILDKLLIDLFRLE